LFVFLSRDSVRGSADAAVLSMVWDCDITLPRFRRSGRRVARQATCAGQNPSIGFGRREAFCLAVHLMEARAEGASPMTRAFLFSVDAGGSAPLRPPSDF
jgi:hypothetical protein